MSAEPSRNVGAPARSWKPYPAYKDSGVEWLGKVPEQGSETTNIFQTGLTGCVLLLNPVILSRINKPQMNADERRLIASFHREERNAEHQKSLRSGITPRRRTRMTRIGRIFTDDLIRAHPCRLCNPCSITFESFSSMPQQEAAL